MLLLNNSGFAGKWSYGNAGKTKVMACNSNKNLALEQGNYTTPAAGQLFNLYGSITDGFVIQAPNWLYVGYNNGAYVAEQARDSKDCSVFCQADAGPEQICLIEKTATRDYYLVYDDNGKLTRTEKPPAIPANALLLNNKVTDGLDTIRNNRSTMANPLTGVYLQEEDLQHVTFIGSDVSHANFSKAILNQTNFNGTTADGAIFDQARTTKWVANGVEFKNCSFVNIDLTNASIAGITFQNCIMIKVNFSDATIQSSKFLQCQMTGSSFRRTKLNYADFTGSNLSNSDFSEALGVNDIAGFEDAVLIGCNLKGTDFTNIRINAKTNFMNAILDECVFTGKDLSNGVFARASMKKVNLDNTILNGAQLAFSNLESASVKGSVSMVGANLSNANLSYAQLPGAQLGAKKTIDTLTRSDDVLKQLNDSKVPSVLATMLTLSSAAYVKPVLKDIAWEVIDGEKHYQVNNTGDRLLIQTVDTTITNAAILSNAYMFMTNFEQANLYAAEMSGVHWYGSSASAKGADLGLANLSGSFLSNMKFSQSQMQGCTLDYAVLVGTVFEGANLNPAANLKPTSFAFSSMQSAQFNGISGLNAANLTNTAFAVPQGVPLFTINSSFTTTLNRNAISAGLRTAFTNAVYPLTAKAAITVITDGKEWTISNTDADNASQTGYGNFYLHYEEPGNGIQQIRVYGASPLLALSANGKGGQDQLHLAFGPTLVNKSQLNSETTCPSGIKYRFLSPYLVYEELMTAALPPKPPTCLNCWD